MIQEEAGLLSNTENCSNLATIMIKGIRDTPTKLRPRNNLYVCIGPTKTHHKYGYSFFYSDIAKINHKWQFSFKNQNDAHFAVSVYKRRAFGKDKFVGNTEVRLSEFMCGINQEKSIFDNNGQFAGYVNLQVIY